MSQVAKKVNRKTRRSKKRGSEVRIDESLAAHNVTRTELQNMKFIKEATGCCEPLSILYALRSRGDLSSAIHVLLSKEPCTQQPTKLALGEGQGRSSQGDRGEEGIDEGTRLGNTLSKKARKRREKAKKKAGAVLSDLTNNLDKTTNARSQAMREQKTFEDVVLSVQRLKKIYERDSNVSASTSGLVVHTESPSDTTEELSSSNDKSIDETASDSSADKEDSKSAGRVTIDTSKHRSVKEILTSGLYSNHGDHEMPYVFSELESGANKSSEGSVDIQSVEMENSSDDSCNCSQNCCSDVTSEKEEGKDMNASLSSIASLEIDDANEKNEHGSTVPLDGMYTEVEMVEIIKTEKPVPQLPEHVDQSSSYDIHPILSDDITVPKEREIDNVVEVNVESKPVKTTRTRDALIHDYMCFSAAF